MTAALRTAACLICVLAVACSFTTAASEFHVSVRGNDANSGAPGAPLRTIQRAADFAQPGDIITAHQGTYRERINPPRGGESVARRITYRAAPGERVEIKGSEVVTNWTKVENDTWKLTLPNSFFGDFNPYSDLIHGDWFNPKGRQHHTGAVYLNGVWLIEAAKLEDVLQPVGKPPNLWFAQVDRANTTIWAQFYKVNPNEQRVEINVRQTVFYPDKRGRNFITVRGFALRHAATPWAPPTAEQIGAIGTHWSKCWIIESNVISHSICSGISLGKYGDAWDNTSAETAEGYVKTIERALESGWNRETIGHHIVRNNEISQCEQAGIVGSLGAAFSTVSGNTIHDIHVRRLFTGAEMAGIKFHAAVDTVIRSNHIFRTCRGLWLDWMAQGTRVSQNLFHDNATDDLLLEVNHGPFLVDNNLFLSGVNLLDMSEGGAYVHNLFTGKIVSRTEPNRATPFHKAHSTTLAGMDQIRGGDDRFYNNIFVGDGELKAVTASISIAGKDSARATGYGLWVYDSRQRPLRTGGNVYYYGARPYAGETNALVFATANPKPEIVQTNNRVMLSLQLGPDLAKATTALVTTRLLGKAKIPKLPFENPDGTAIRVDRDYFNHLRKETAPTAGPFAAYGADQLELEAW